MAAVAGYIFEVIARLLAIWIVCGLVWLTLYRRESARGPTRDGL